MGLELQHVLNFITAYVLRLKFIYLVIACIRWALSLVVNGIRITTCTQFYHCVCFKVKIYFKNWLLIVMRVYCHIGVLCFPA